MGQVRISNTQQTEFAHVSQNFKFLIATDHE